MHKYSTEFLRKTIELWQKYSNEPISLEGAQEIADNMIEFFSCLIELDNKYNGPADNNK